MSLNAEGIFIEASCLMYKKLNYRRRRLTSALPKFCNNKITNKTNMSKRNHSNKLVKTEDGVEWYADGTILLIRCPKCKCENYAMAVADGVCCWCGYKAKPITPNE